MDNDLNIEIDIPKSYSNEAHQNKTEDVTVSEVPNSTNKVKRITIRGVLKHDATHG